MLMENQKFPIIVLLNVQAESIATIWIKIFNWYFIAMDIVFSGITLYLIITIVNFYLVFGVIYTIFWLTLPFYNALFLLASDNY